MAEPFRVQSNLPRNTRLFSAPVMDKTGREYLAVIAKYTFHAGADGLVTSCNDDPAEVDLADTYNGESPAKASIRRPSQLFEYKPGTDVVLLGCAVPRDPAAHVDVSLRVGRIAKTVRAHGLRVWQMGTFGGLKPGPARPFREPVPLIYERAWGGTDLSDEKKPVADPGNPVGIGVRRDAKTLVDQPAAALEDPAHPIDGRSNRAAAFNPIHRHWQPRAQYAGTYDDVWRDTKMPLLPDDFDSRYHVCVPPDQWSEVPLRSDEPFEVSGATPEGVWRFQLPRIAVGFSSFSGGRRTEHRTHLDTVLLDAEARRIELTWRAAMPLPRKYEMLERVVVFEKAVA
jgi:hypothetical protein